MPTITIDLPDNLNVPADWDARAFFAAKMYEAGILSCNQAAQSAGVPPSAFVEPNKESAAEDTQSESWFTPEEHAQFRENRRRLAEERKKSTENESRRIFEIVTPLSGCYRRGHSKTK